MKVGNSLELKIESVVIQCCMPVIVCEDTAKHMKYRRDNKLLLFEAVSYSIDEIGMWRTYANSILKHTK